MVEENELARLARDLGDVPENFGPRARSAIGRTAQLTRDSWRDKVNGARALPHLARTISYTIQSGAGVTGSGFGGQIEAEIGPERGGQGSLGHLHELGSPTSGPHGFGLAALQENEADFERGIARAIDDALKAQGL